MSPRLRRAAVVALVVTLVAHVAAWIAVSAWRRERGVEKQTGVVIHGVTVGIDLQAAALTLRAQAHAWERSLPLAAVVDGVARPIEFGAQPPQVAGVTMQVAARVPLEGAQREATVIVSVQPDADLVVLMLSVAPFGSASPHSVALRAEVATGGQSAFLSGVGEIADIGTNKGKFLLVDADRLTLGFGAVRGAVDVAALVDESDEVGSPMRLAVTGPAGATGQGGRIDADLRVVLGPSSRVVGGLFRVAGERTLRVKGEVTGTTKGARVFGLDEARLPVLRVDTDATGHFTLSAPPTVVEWYATLGSSLTSTPVRWRPGGPTDLRLDVAPGGTLRIRVSDPDTRRPLTARVLVRGEGATLDPSFGPDYRATGAGPIIDALRGDVETPVPEGRYLVSATKGIEYSIDARSVVVEPGRTVAVDLELRHVVPAEGLVGCDLHVHARPSFDSPVLPEDRVLSLVAAGIGFAVPSEHNIVGDYGPALTTLDLSRQLATVSGVEVTTYQPRFGHFGVFPYPKGSVPPYRGTTAAQLFSLAHKDPARVLQVNHPRLSKGIGYFEVVRFDPSASHPPPGMRTDFDTLEVYNGFDERDPARVDVVLRDWYSLLNQGFRYAATGSSDSHRIQFQWAGYPRTMAYVPGAPFGDDGVAVDPLAVVAAIKKGRAFVTSGPLVDLEVAGAHPGEDAPASEGRVQAHVTVRAAPWIDVTSVELVVAGRVAQTIPIPSRPQTTGPEPGTLADAQLRTLRLEETVTVDVGVNEGWMLAVVRGTRSLEGVLPFMAVPPMAFTNPVWLIHDPAAYFGPPRPRK